MRLLRTVGLITLVGTQALADEVYWNKYLNFTATLPAGFVRTHTTSSGDGATFSDASGAEIDVYGYEMDLELEADLVERIYFWTDDGGTITYQASGEDWYVLSGLTGTGAVFYNHQISGEDCDGRPILAVMTLTYDPAEKARIDPLIGPAAASLRFLLCR